MIGNILLRLVALALVGFVSLVLVGLWDRYDQEARALGFGGIYQHYLASRVGFPSEPQAYLAPAADAGHVRIEDGVRGTAALEE
jgi:hypothetical protein